MSELLYKLKKFLIVSAFSKESIIKQELLLVVLWFMMLKLLSIENEVMKLWLKYLIFII